MVVYCVVDVGLRLDCPLGDSVDVFVRREDAERFVQEVRDDAPDEAETLTIVERELTTGTLN